MYLYSEWEGKFYFWKGHSKQEYASFLKYLTTSDHTYKTVENMEGWDELLADWP